MNALSWGKSSRWSCFVLAGIILIAAGVRFYHLGRNSYWQDEFLSLENSSGNVTPLKSLPTNRLIVSPPHLTRLNRSASWPQLWRLPDGDLHPPLYFILLRFWREGFGDSEWVVRSFSAIASVVALILFFLAMRLQSPMSVALWATALLAVAGSQINASQNARDYALWMMLAFGAAYFMLRILHRGFSWGGGITLGILTLALLLTDYLAIFCIVSLLIYAAIAMRQKARLLTIAVFLVAFVLYLGIWGPELLHISHFDTGWLTDRSAHPYWQTTLRIIELPLSSFSILGQSLLVAILFFVLLAAAIISARRDPQIIFWVIWFAPLIAAVIFADLLHHSLMLNFSRYTFVASTAFCALVPVTSRHIFRRFCWVAPAALFCIAAGSIPWAFPLPTEWRDVARLFRQDVQPDDVIVYTGGNWNPSAPFSLFLGINHYAPELPGKTLLLTDVHAPITQVLPQTGHSVWMICYQTNLPPQAIFPNSRVVQAMVLPNIGRVAQLEAR
ncbi:MAG TPA: glycosyltransferase family 39 protein [Tepidisphaeraceae bacterium]|jgi:uncharacterized membrane protein